MWLQSLCCDLEQLSSRSTLFSARGTWDNYAHLGGLMGTQWCWSTWQGHVHGSVLFRSWLQEEHAQIWLSAGDPRPAWRHRALEGATEPTACSVFPLLP